MAHVAYVKLLHRDPLRGRILSVQADVEEAEALPKLVRTVPIGQELIGLNDDQARVARPGDLAVIENSRAVGILDARTGKRRR